MLKGIEAKWKNAADPFRLAWVPDIKRSKGIICEGRINYNGLTHYSWEKTEPNVVISFVALTVTKYRVQVTHRVEHTFSMHSLARFYERSGFRDDADLIGAITLALNVEPKQHELGEDVSVGNWRGLIKRAPVGDDHILVWCARTFYMDKE